MIRLQRVAVPHVCMAAKMIKKCTEIVLDAQKKAQILLVQYEFLFKYSDLFSR